jgi:hypothetical protein
LLDEHGVAVGLGLELGLAHQGARVGGGGHGVRSASEKPRARSWERQ